MELVTTRIPDPGFGGVTKSTFFSFLTKIDSGSVLSSPLSLIIVNGSCFLFFLLTSPFWEDEVVGFLVSSGKKQWS